MEKGGENNEKAMAENGSYSMSSSQFTDSEETSGMSPSKCQCNARCVRSFIRRNLLLLLLITSLAAGVGLGAALRQLDPPLDKRQQMYFRFPGDILMNMLKALVLPLIVSSLISGVSSLDSSASGKLGLVAVCYYMLTTLSAVLLGILMVTTIKPGDRSSQETSGGDVAAEPGNIADSFLDLIRNMLPDNIVEACFRQTRTYQVPVNVTNQTACGNLTAPECNATYVMYDYDIRKGDGINVLGLVVFSIALGIALSYLGEKGRAFRDMCSSLAEATMCLVTAVIWYSPIGIMFLIAAEVIKMEDPVAEIIALGFYMVTVLSGLFIHGFIVLPLIYVVLVRRNPLTFLFGTLQALITAFGTGSSSATLPVTYKCLEERNRIDPRVTRFVLPVGATINMDGTALYEAVAAIFIAQSNGMNLNPAQIVTTSITATLASIGAASVPQAGLVTMVIVLSAIGLPAEEVTKILAIDWLIDRFRTMINVEGDCIGAAVVSHLCRRQLAPNKDTDQPEKDEMNSDTTSDDLTIL